MGNGLQEENKTLKALIARLKNDQWSQALAAQVKAGVTSDAAGRIILDGVAKEIDIALGNRKPDDDPLEKALRAVNDGNMQMIRDAVGFTRV